jgi:RNA polymerase sigma-70 factor (ECF subfamily)
LQTATGQDIRLAMRGLEVDEGAEAARLRAAFESHHARMFRAAWRVTGSGDDAEDALQGVFLNLLRRGSWPDVEEQALGPYLHRAAVNAALDILRSRGRRQVIPLEVASRTPAPGRNAAERGEDADLRGHLRRGLSELSPRAAEIFTLRYVEGFGNQEIADLVGASESAVGVSLHRSRERLRRLLADIPGEGA